MSLLDPARTLEFGALHGQLASPLLGGGMVLSAHKIVDHGWRAPLLLVPGIFRCDVRPFEDNLQTMLRPLDLDAPWGARSTHASPWGKRLAEADVPWRGQWVCMLGLEPRSVVAKVELAVSRLAGRAASHVVAQAVLRETDPELVRTAL